MGTLASLTNVTYHYPDRERPSLSSVSLELGPAEFVLVLGPSGSGKSTLLRLLCGLVPHFHGGIFAGQAVVAGSDVCLSTPRDLARRVGLVFQDPENQAVMNSVEREIAFGLENLGMSPGAIGRLVEEALISMGLTALRRASLRSLSGGELQKVALASVLAMQPHLLLLDEPTSQLDPISSEELLSSLRRLLEDTGSTVVLAEHRAERCLHLATRVVYMKEGAIVHDSSPAEFCRWALRNHPEFLPPVTRLFGACGNGHPTGAGGQAGSLREGASIPLTVQDARMLLERGGVAVRSARNGGCAGGGVVGSGGAGCSAGAARSAGATLLSGGEALPRRVAGDLLLETRDLVVGYAPDLPLLEQVNLRLRAGECVALMGENGCGKSTLVKHFNGLLSPLKGRVLLGGKDVREYSVASAAWLCGLLGQNPNDYFVKDSVREEILHTVRHHGIAGSEQTALVDRTIAELELEGLLDRDPRELSGGERSRVALATVSVTRPPLIVLDEPTRGIDPSSKARLGAVLTQWVKDGRCVVVVTHDVEFAARHAQRIILLGSGRVLADGPPQEVLDGALYFSTQINRLLRHRVPGALAEPDVEVVCS